MTHLLHWLQDRSPVILIGGEELASEKRDWDIDYGCAVVIDRNDLPKHFFAKMRFVRFMWMFRKPGGPNLGLKIGGAGDEFLARSGFAPNEHTGGRRL